MASRFAITLQDSGGNALTGKTVRLRTTGDVLIDTFTDNSDGAYYISVAASGEYNITIDGEAAQDELTGIFIAVDDVSSHIADTSNPHEVEADRVDIADAGGYFTGTDVEAALQECGVDIAALGDADNISIADAGGIITATDVEAALQELAADIDALEAAIVLNFADPHYIDETKTPSQNFEILDNALYAQVVQAGNIGYVMLYKQYEVAGFADTDAAASLNYWRESANSYTVKIRNSFFKADLAEKSLVLRYEARMSAAGTGGITLTCGALSEENNISSTSWFYGYLDLDISSLGAGSTAHVISVEIKGNGTQLIHMRNIELYVKRY